MVPLTAVRCRVCLDHPAEGGGESGHGHGTGAKAADHGKHFGAHLNVPGNQPLSALPSLSHPLSTSLPHPLYLTLFSFRASSLSRTSLPGPRLYTCRRSLVRASIGIQVVLD